MFSSLRQLRQRRAAVREFLAVRRTKPLCSVLLEKLEDRTLLSSIPQNVLSELPELESSNLVFSGVPTTVTPGETIHYSLTVSPSAVSSSANVPTYDSVFGYPYLAMSYVKQGSVTINGVPANQGLQDAEIGSPVYYFPYTPGLTGTPTVEPNPDIQALTAYEQTDVLQSPTVNGSGINPPLTGTINVTATIDPNAPTESITETSSLNGETLASGPWVIAVAEIETNDGSLPTWSSALPFTIAPDAPVFETSGFFAGSNPTGSVDTPLGPSVKVDVIGAGGAIDSSYNGNVTITLSGGPTGASLLAADGKTPVASVTVKADNGVADFSGQAAILVNQANLPPSLPYTLTATLADGTSNPSPTFSVQGHTLMFSGQPGNTSTGDLLPVQVQADLSGSVDTSYTGPVQLQLADGNGNPISSSTVGFESQAGVFDGDTITINASGGTADFSKLLRVNTAGTYTVIASLPDEPSAPPQQSNAFTLSTHQVVIQLPSPMGGGPNETLPAVSVQVDNSQGNPDPNYDGNVVLTLHGGLANGGDNGAGLSGGNVEASGGTATFSNLVVNQSGQDYTLTATLAADSAASSQPSTPGFNVSDTLVFQTQPPAEGVPGEPLGTPPPISSTPTPVQVEVIDGTGNPDKKFVSSIMLALSGGPTGATLGGDINVRPANGVATFGSLSISKVGNGYQLVASTPGNPAVMNSTPSNSINIVPHDLVFAPVFPTPPTKAGVSGAPVLPGGVPIEVDAYDNQGNIDTSYSADMVLTLNIISQSNTDGKVATLLDASGKPVPSLKVPSSGGEAKFSNVIISEPGTYTLTATATEPGVLPNPPGTITDTSPQFVIGHDTPDIVTQPPPYVGSNENFLSPAQPIMVQVQNSAGQVDPSYNGMVTMTIEGLSKSGQTPTLGGTVTVPARSGVATFTNLTVNLLGTGYDLVATLPDGTPGAASDPFSVVPETFQFLPLQSVFPVPTGVPGQPIAPSIQVGAFLNTGTGAPIADPNFNGTLTLNLDQNSVGATVSNNTSTASSAGVFTFSQLAFSTPSGPNGFTLTPSDGNPNDTGEISAPIVIVPHGVSFDPADEPGNTIVNEAMTQNIVVNVTDLSGNPDPTFSGLVTLTLVGGSLVNPDTGQLVSSLTTNAISGRAHFIHPIIATTGQGLVFTASIDEPGSGTAFSTTFNVSSASPVSQSLTASRSVITSGQSVVTTDVLTVNTTTGESLQAVVGIPLSAAKAKAKPVPHPTGRVFFEDNGKILRRVPVVLAHGVAEAKARLKLTTPGVQTISAVYMPNARSKKLGYTETTTTTIVTVLPALPKKPKHK